MDRRVRHDRTWNRVRRQGRANRRVREGHHYLLSGAKTFISNGTVCDQVIVVAKTDPAAGAKGVSLFVVDAGLPGFTRGHR